MAGSLSIAKTGLIQGSNVMNVEASNMAISQTVAGKKSSPFIDAIAAYNKNQGVTNGVTGSTIQNISTAGTLEKVDNPLYCAAGDNGFFVVDNGYTKIGTWGFNNKGDLVNHLGQRLNAYELDVNGNIIDPSTGLKVTPNATSKLYMAGINKNNIKLNPTATTNINLSYRLPVYGNVPGDTYPIDVTVLDSLGISHHLKLNMTRATVTTTPTGKQISSANSTILGSSVGPAAPVAANANTSSAWFVTVVSQDGTDTVAAPYNDVNNPTIIEFDQNGLPLSFAGSSAATATMPNLNITHGNGSALSNITLNFGGIGKNNGLVAQEADAKIFDITADGNTEGQFESLAWDEDGYGTVIFDNGEARKMFLLPMAYFADQDKLQFKNDGTYIATSASGVANYGRANTSPIGKLGVSTLEMANVSEIETQIKIITNQRYYMAQTTVFKIAREMAEALDNLV
ncbi:MAG: hypothetical protein NEHIOOID_00288 [Holosporales bacterium]